jgi:hypothetical protein
MQIKINKLLSKIPQYEITRNRFFEIMNIKKTTDRYDIHGEKKVKISAAKSKMTTFGRHTPTRIKSEYIKGPYALVCLLTSADKDPDNPDSYTYAATIVFSDIEATRVYRDSLNDGFVDAKFTDDTIMLIAVQDTNTKENQYIQIDGEPTGYNCWKFEENDDLNKNNQELIQNYIKKTTEEFSLNESQVFVVIQLEDA